MTEIPPPPPAYGAPVPPAGANPPKNWMGLTSLILGIVAVLLGCCCGSGLLLGPGAIVLGYLGKQAAAKGEASNGNLANVGFILGIVGVAFGLFSIVWGLINGFATSVNDFS